MGKKIKEIDPCTLKRWMDDSQVILVDVREQCEYQEERISNSTLLPISQFKADKVPSAPSAKKVVFYCKSGHRSAYAAACWSVEKQGSEAYNLAGGLVAWQHKGLPVEKG
ncbi:rhodanese-like domain-containing protein [Parachlamydia sp. AcF125]|uniref:rhodanese-like domain-containing protein n=1 Tax=Parachlamydia sp. AcF125 TaxID=2795736 RepID=UPI001BC90E9C|nr:rhodanese-like domain-containing protein [Parachlamydia sp. AcF125]MBS4168677.1 Sulfurtransferase [Parachlamydia sp. AcF125]